MNYDLNSTNYDIYDKIWLRALVQCKIDYFYKSYRDELEDFFDSDLYKYLCQELMLPYEKTKGQIRKGKDKRFAPRLE